MVESKACRQMLIMIMGLPGSGKTYLAKKVAKRLEAAHFNTDIIRKELNLQGAYNPEDKEKVYEQMKDNTLRKLEAGDCVVVDATFYKKDLREVFEQIAENCGAVVCRLMAYADEKIIRRRVSKERPDSEADFEVYKKIKSQFEPISSAFFPIPTDRYDDSWMLETALTYIRKCHEEKSG